MAELGVLVDGESLAERRPIMPGAADGDGFVSGERAFELVEADELVRHRGVLAVERERRGGLPDLGIAGVDRDLIVRARIVAVEHEMIGIVIIKQIRRHARVLSVVVDEARQVFESGVRRGGDDAFLVVVRVDERARPDVVLDVLLAGRVDPALGVGELVHDNGVVALEGVVGRFGRQDVGVAGDSGERAQRAGVREVVDRSAQGVELAFEAAQGVLALVPEALAHLVLVERAAFQQHQLADQRAGVDTRDQSRQP